MAKVVVSINGIQGEVEAGCNLLEAAHQIGAGVAHYCFGNAICSTCRMEVVSGEKSLSPQELKERVSLNYHLCFDPKVRLSCQTKVLGPDPVVLIVPKFFKMIAPRDKAKV